MEGMAAIKGKQLYYEIAMDEERILADGIYDLEAIYACMDEAFTINDCILAKIDGKKRIYTRNKDNKDLEKLWLAVGMFDETYWFEKYACHYMFYPMDEAEEDWLEECGILLRRSIRDKVRELVNDMKEVSNTVQYSDVIKKFLVETSYQCTETDDFLLFHQKDFVDYKTGMRLMSVSLEQCEKAQIASLICLMQKNELPDSIMVAFLKNPDEKKQGIKNLVKLLKKTKKTYRAIVLDITNTGWEESCDYTVENCYLTGRMYKNLVSVLHMKGRRWKIIPQDRQMLKGILFDDKYFTTNAPRGKDCDYYQEFGVNCFSYCLPTQGEIKNGEKITIDMYRLGWYVYKLIDLANEKNL